MKAVANGPIIRLASLSVPKTAATGGSIYDHSEWNTGRDLSEEERRCGMLVRLRDAACSPERHQVSLPPLIDGVVKAQTTDFQMNEIDRSGIGAAVKKQAKGRWRKISRAKTLLVEDSSTPFSNPDKTYAPRIQSHGEYIRRIGRLPPSQPLLRFAMFRDGYSLSSVVNRFQYEIGVLPDALYFSVPPGGSFGSFTQYGVAVGVTKEQLPHVSRHYNVHPLIFDDQSYHTLDELSRLTQPPRSRLYRILLRCVRGTTDAVQEQLQSLSRYGSVNYFGMESFGCGSCTLFDLAAFEHRGEYHRAVGGLLQMMAEKDPFHYPSFMSYLNAEESTTIGAVEAWLKACTAARLPRHTRELLGSLHRYHLHRASGATSATSMRDVWHHTTVLNDSRKSAAHFIWNAMASQRLITYGDRVVKGDVVQVDNQEDGEGVVVVQSEEEAQKYTIDDVVLPVPLPHSSTVVAPVFPQHAVNEDLYRTFANKHSLSFLFDTTSQPLNTPVMSSTTPEYRRILVKPRQLQAAVIRDPNSFAALKSDLFLLQERKLTESSSLDYDQRVREPSRFNVSERFAEKMTTICASRSGENSVALCFALPADTSPWVLLRESFSLKYATFNDCYGVE